MKLDDSIAVKLLPAFPPIHKWDEDAQEQFINRIIESELEELRKVRHILRNSGIRFSFENKTTSKQVEFIFQEYEKLRNMCGWNSTDVVQLHADIDSPVEELREGFRQLELRAKEQGDEIAATVAGSHHKYADKLVVQLGGLSVHEPN